MITKDMKIQNILKKYPETTPIFYGFQLQGCFGCLSAKFETLEQASLLHGFVLEYMLFELNKAVASYQERKLRIKKQFLP